MEDNDEPTARKESKVLSGAMLVFVSIFFVVIAAIVVGALISLI